LVGIIQIICIFAAYKFLTLPLAVCKCGVSRLGGGVIKKRSMNWTIEELNAIRQRLKHIAAVKRGCGNPWHKIAKTVGCHPHNVKIFLEQGVKYPKLQHKRMIAEANKIIKDYIARPTNDEHD
jgi:uncharacterized membrane protein YhiD involved in acid resistance